MKSIKPKILFLRLYIENKSEEESEMKKTVIFVILISIVVTMSSCGGTRETTNPVNVTQGNNESVAPSNFSEDSKTNTFSEKKCGNNAYWDYNNGQLTITGSGDIYDFYVELDPNSVQTSWISDMPWFDVKRDIKQITVSDGITKIGTNSFRGCYSAQIITMPESLVSIGEMAFAGCLSLETIVIPDSVKTLGERAFWNCGVKNLVLGSGIEKCGKIICKDCDNLTTLTLKEGIKEIGEEAFKGCSGISRIELPNGLKNVGEAAFSDCSGVREIIIGSGLTKIPAHLFSGCRSETLVIPEGVTSIGIGAFYGNKTVTSITLPSTLTSISKWAFTQCDKLKDVYFNGTQEQWRAITKEKGNEPLTKANIHYQ